MTISEAIKQGYSELAHPSFGGSGRAKFHVVNKEAGTYGPWVEIHDDATDAGVLEPPKIIAVELPDDDLYEVFESTHSQGETNHD